MGNIEVKLKVDVRKVKDLKDYQTISEKDAVELLKQFKKDELISFILETGEYSIDDAEEDIIEPIEDDQEEDLIDDDDDLDEINKVIASQKNSVKKSEIKKSKVKSKTKDIDDDLDDFDDDDNDDDLDEI